jgi:hypothetical protein
VCTALWLHHVTALDTGLAVNVFWRNLDPGLYDAKDVYGNKDPIPASQALQLMQRALTLLHKLPHEYTHFYQHMMQASISRQLTDCSTCHDNSVADTSCACDGNCVDSAVALTRLNIDNESLNPA